MYGPHLMAELDKKLVFKQGTNYYYPNQEPKTTDTGESIWELVKQYSENIKVQEDKKKANAIEWQPMEAHQFRGASLTYAGGSH